LDEPPTTEGWIHEVKHDGYRTILAVEGAATCAFTRNGHDWTRQYRTIVSSAAQLPCWNAIIDGEMVVQDPPVVKHTGKQQAQWLKPGLIARVRFLRGEEKLRHATVMAVRVA
jgi:ATP-dependent DNA ligase